jgi:anti-sigma regulatory factor (Ser/Thr protein kinase)
MKHTLEVTVAIENMDKVMAFIEEHTTHIPNPKVAGQLVMVVEELALNVFNYAYDGQSGFFSLSIETFPEQACVVMEFRDRGKEFNPLSQAEPDVSLPIDKREVGGLGIMLSKKLTDTQNYIRDGGENVFTVTKKY